MPFNINISHFLLKIGRVQKCENGITGEIFHPHPFEKRMNEPFRFRNSFGPIPFVRE